MRLYIRVVVVAFLIVLAGCSGTPTTSQDIEIADRTDLDCDDRASEFTATASISPRGPGQDLVGTIGYQGNNGEMNSIETFEVSGETTHTVEVSYSDLNVDSDTRIYVVVEAEGFLSNEEIGSARTSRVLVESKQDDQPVLDPNLIVETEYPTPGEEVQFSLEEKSDDGCGIRTIQWDFNQDGEIDTTGSPVIHTFESDGYHRINTTIETTTGVETTVSQTVLVTDDPGMKFRDVADPAPRSTVYPQGIFQVSLTLVIISIVFLGIRYRK